MDAISVSSDAGWDARYAEKGTDGPRGQFTTWCTSIVSPFELDVKRISEYFHKFRNERLSENRQPSGPIAILFDGLPVKADQLRAIGRFRVERFALDRRGSAERGQFMEELHDGSF
jgi:hypothetical protein